MAYYFLNKRGEKEYVDVISIANLGPCRNGGTRELCIIQWPNGKGDLHPPCLDIRRWSPPDENGDKRAWTGTTIPDDQITEIINGVQKYATMIENNTNIRQIKEMEGTWPECYSGETIPCDECPDSYGLDYCPHSSCRYGFYDDEKNNTNNNRTNTDEIPF